MVMKATERESILTVVLFKYIYLVMRKEKKKEKRKIDSPIETNQTYY